MLLCSLQMLVQIWREGHYETCTTAAVETLVRLRADGEIAEVGGVGRRVASWPGFVEKGYWGSEGETGCLCGYPPSRKH